MKFDMNRAWNRTRIMITGNRDLVLVTAGLFFFLPFLAALLMLPQLIGDIPPPDAGPEAIQAFIQNLPASVWLMILVLSLVQAMGTLGLLVLVGDTSRPTLGSALSRGFVALAPYIVTQLLLGMGLQLLALIPQVLAAASGSAAIQFVADLVLFVVTIYLIARFSLAGVAMVLERKFNPIRAMLRSWQLTAGNGMRLASFYLLLGIAAIVIGLLAYFLLALIFSLAGPQASLIGASIALAAIGSIMLVLFMAVMAAAHRQLSGGGEAEGPSMPLG
ncbi:MAG TPA: hypothetical protein VGA34_09860 [Alteraurantiacibacter sp.]|jgi:hypothetical protein